MARKIKMVVWVFGWIILLLLIFVGVVFAKRSMNNWNPKSCIAYQPSKMTQVVLGYNGPRCDIFGDYMPQQGITGITWCVDRNGNRVAGSEVVVGYSRKQPCQSNSIGNTITTLWDQVLAKYNKVVKG